MTSSIGQGAYGKPTKLAVPRSILSGSTSGIGGQSTESCARYDSTYLFNYLYVPGSKRFLMPSRQIYDGPKGNWGQRLITKVNLRKQVSGASGYLRDPSKRMKNHEFKSINFGLVEKVNPQLPRGGNVPQVVGSSNTADPRSFYSDYNWGNPEPQKHDVPEGGYYTFPPNGKEESQQLNAETNYTSASASLNPMSGTSGLGALAKRASINEIIDGYMASMNQSPQLVNEQIENTLGNQDFAVRRASRITGAFESKKFQDIRSALGVAQNMIQNMPPPLMIEPPPPRKNKKKSPRIKDANMKDAKPIKKKKEKPVKDANMKDAKPIKEKPNAKPIKEKPDTDMKEAKSNKRKGSNPNINLYDAQPSKLRKVLKREKRKGYDMKEAQPSKLRKVLKE